MTREHLFINLFGKTKFYLGLFIGCSWTILIYIFFAYYREILRWETFYKDLIILTHQEFMIYNLFFAAVSVTVGFGFAVAFWFQNIRTSNTPRRKPNYVVAFSFFWVIMLLFVVAKSGLILSGILYLTYGYDDQLNLTRESPELLFLLPTVFFLNIWTPIRLRYQAGKWFLHSLIAFVSIATLLAFSSPIDQSILNNSWSKYMIPYNKVVDEDISIAKSNGITFSEQAILASRYNNKERVVSLLKSLKQRFKSKIPIPTDSIVLELILIKKTTIRALTNDWEDMSNPWPFALPKDIYNQILIESKDSLRNQYLKEILVEYKQIFKKEEKEPWELAEMDGLYDKYDTRSFMRRWYGLIRRETDKYWALLFPE